MNEYLSSVIVIFIMQYFPQTISFDDLTLRERKDKERRTDRIRDLPTTQLNDLRIKNKRSKFDLSLWQKKIVIIQVVFAHLNLVSFLCGTLRHS